MKINGRDISSLLRFVDNPARYVGGEWGAIVKPDPGMFRVAISFPDLYEIGMSNMAIKLLYGALNALPRVAAERVFVPAPDFEEALRDAAIPLYTLETRTAVRDCDILAVSYAYELLATNIITLLDSSGIPRHREDRGDRDPIVVAGGASATNPRPMSAFVDAFYIGEAEGELPEIIASFAEARRNGATRDDLLEIAYAQRSIWMPARPRPARRAIWHGFTGTTTAPDGPPAAFGLGFPVPSMRVIQDHGVTEIMRGCPQGCRFCHAGVYYRPYRMKSTDEIITEIDWLVHRMGYRDITLSSLSSGDYDGIHELMTILNKRYHGLGVNFQLPSLRVDSFTLPLLEEMSTVKRSSLTFAVESPDEASQRVVNKRVPVEQVAEILATAKEKGWRHAKLYFMIGLPVPDSSRDVERIAEYLGYLRSKVKIEYVVNVGTFIPKPHTPFQWEPQLDRVEAEARMRRLVQSVPRGVTVRYHDPWMSYLEGVLSRGDERTGEAIARAHAAGARLDAWGEHVQKDIWDHAIDSVPGSDRGLRGFSSDERLPWEDVLPGVSPRVLLRERDKARNGELTERCAPECTTPCGVCNSVTKPIHADSVQRRSIDPVPSSEGVRPRSLLPGEQGRRMQMIVLYRKEGPAVYLSHLSVVRVFERIWNRLQIPIELSSGYAPKARMNFGQPLPLGIESRYELMTVFVQKDIPLENVFDRFSAVAPDGFSVTALILIHHEGNSPKIPAPMQRYGGSRYKMDARDGLVFNERHGSLEGMTIRFDDDTPDQAVLELSRRAPGLGRLIDRNSGYAPRITRIDMWDDETGLSMFDWYAQRAYAVWQPNPREPANTSLRQSRL